MAVIPDPNTSQFAPQHQIIYSYCDRRVRPNDIVGTVAFNANIPGYVIGKVRTEDKFTFVDMPEDVVEQVLKQNGNNRLGKDKFGLVKA